MYLNLLSEKCCGITHIPCLPLNSSTSQLLNNLLQYCVTLLHSRVSLPEIFSLKLNKRYSVLVACCSVLDACRAVDQSP